MVTFSLRRVVFIFGFVGLFGFTAYLAQDDWSHRLQTRALTQENANLQAALDSLEAKHKKIMESIEDKNTDFRDALTRLKKENEDLRGIINHVREESRKSLDEKTYLEEILIHKTQENDRLRKTPSYSDQPLSGESVNLADELHRRNKQLQTLEEQNRLLAEKLEKLYSTTSMKIDEINIAKIALEETVSIAKQKIDEEWNAVNLGSISAQSGGPVPAKRDVPARLPRSEGKVLAVNSEHGFVVVDLGRVDNLKTQEELEVLKNGHPIARLSVLELRDVMAACNIRDLEDGSQIQVNDPVSVRRAPAPPSEGVINPIF